MLNKKQLQAKLLFEQGYNLFISGSAGTGKSFMIKLFKRFTSLTSSASAKENKTMTKTTKKMTKKTTKKRSKNSCRLLRS